MNEIIMECNIGGSSVLVEKPCTMLYLDSANQMLWISRPIRTGYDHFTLVDGKNRHRLAADEHLMSDGYLVSLRLEEQHLSALGGPETLKRLTAIPVLSNIDTSQSDVTLHHYVEESEPPIDTLRAIAWYASSHLTEIKQSGLAHVLEQATLDDLTRCCTPSAQRIVDRDKRLFAELLQAIEAHRLIFVLGGTKSGLSSFLYQFKTSLPSQTPSGCHIPSDFDPRYFEEIQSLLRTIHKKGPDDPLDGRLATTSVFISLAYAAYQSLCDADGTDQTSLSTVVPKTAQSNAQEFAVQYLGEIYRQRMNDEEITEIEPFLFFLGRMVDAAGRNKMLTIVLSFPSLSNWLRETHGQHAGGRISSSLWEQLKLFSNRNYSKDTGKPKARSLMDGFKYNVGIVVEVQRLSYPDMGEAFCKQSVLVMPPYSDEELAAVWRVRTHKPDTPEIITEIRTLTGGVPSFVDLFFDCLEASSSNMPVNEGSITMQVTRAGELAQCILSDEEWYPKTAQIEKIRWKWKRYVDDLSSRMSPQARTDTKALLDLTLAVDVKQKISKPQTTEWLEAGLFWLRHPIKNHTLTALDEYPHFRTFPIPRLICTFIEAFTTPEGTF